MDYRMLEVDFFSRNYSIDDHLGDGSFGMTFQCLNKLDGKTYAVKAIPCSNKATETVLRECKAMASLQHENIVHYQTAWMEAGVPLIAKNFVYKILGPKPKKDETPVRTVYIAMKCYPRVLSKEIEKGMLTEHDIQKIFEGLAKGLESIHEEKWVHCDLYPGNIFLDASGEPKIGDFGLAKKIGEKGEGHQIGNRLYQAPEVIAGKQYTPGADLFSFALIMIELVCSLESHEKWDTFSDAKAGLLPKELTDRNDLISESVHQILTAAPGERMKASTLVARIGSF